MELARELDIDAYRESELGALAGIEKSGHCFLRPPIGRGYDDGLLTAAVICRMLARAAPR